MCYLCKLKLNWEVILAHRTKVITVEHRWLQVTTLLLVPPVMVHMAKSPLVSQYDLSSIRRVKCGAAPLSRETELQFKHVFNAGDIQQGIYALSKQPASLSALSISLNLLSTFSFACLSFHSFS